MARRRGLRVSYREAGAVLCATDLDELPEAPTLRQITWKLIPGGQLADPKTSFQAVQDGLMQGGLEISTYVPNLVPSLNTIYSTIVFVDDTVAASWRCGRDLHAQLPVVH